MQGQARLIPSGSDGTFDTAGSPRVAIVLDPDGAAAGSVTIEGSLDGTIYVIMATQAVAASTPTLIHLVDLPVQTLKVVTSALGAGNVDAYIMAEKVNSR